MTQLIEQPLIAADGHAIAGRFFMPSAEPVGALLFVPALGVAQTYYEDIARWAADHGYLAATFDYRGVGLSRPGRLRGLDIDVVGWGRLDAQAALDALAARAPDKPLIWVGHSLGGQILPFLERRERISKMITVASGSGYWRENSSELKRRVWLLWYLVGPLSLAMFGYFPGNRLNMVGDLPKPVMQQWRRWCLHPEYAVGVEPGARERYAAVRTPIVSLSFSDDEFMSARNTESLHGFYTNAPRTMVRISPREAGVQRIGHFGFFKPALSALWQRYLLPQLAVERGEAA